MTEIQGDITTIQGDVTNIQNGTTQITGAVYYDQKDGSYDMDNITFKGEGGTQLHNVKAGVADTDAVNVKQMKDADAQTLADSKTYTDTAKEEAISTSNRADRGP